MRNDSFSVLGVMSGTSLDGIDLCYSKFTYGDSWEFNIIKSTTIPYQATWREKLSLAITKDRDSIDKLNQDYTSYLGGTIYKFIEDNQIKDLDAICSHGHTIFHEPDKGYTLQIGNLPELASIVGKKVICDFRLQDVKFGGQGAPLVPIGDQLLFHKYDFCINLGGFANVSFDQDNKRIAFDICPVNIVLNHYVKKMNMLFDDRGELAKSGKINKSLLKQLNYLEFYSIKHPKSLGLEWVIDYIFPLIDSFNLPISDILCTFAEHVAIQINKSTQYKNEASILFTGGGVFNDFLMKRISTQTPHQVVVPDNDIIEYKEALIFGFLGVLKLRNEVNCLSSVTGAKKDHSSGNIFLP
jgi:anhydro-N-acetylmuramic acid kinase